MAYRPETGNVADELRNDRTGKVRKLLKQREKIAEKTENAKDEAEANKRRKLNMGKAGVYYLREFFMMILALNANIDRFGASAADVLEEEFSKQTIGLTSIEEFREKRRNIDELIEQTQKLKNQTTEKKKKIVQTVKKSTLSFQLGDSDEEDEDDSDEKTPGDDDGDANTGDGEDKQREAPPDEVQGERQAQDDIAPPSGGQLQPRPPMGPPRMAPPSKRTADNAEQERRPLAAEQPPPAVLKSKKNPFVDTSFLRDAARDDLTRRRREELAVQYRNGQEKQKKKLLEVVYSYWDGSGHRRSLQIEQGASVGQFLKIARLQLLNDFAALRTVASDELLYVKEDLILPHKITFYELIRDRVRGKSGPLFAFGVHEDVTEQADIRVERMDTHPGKIVQRAWYEQNKHVFPQKRWEVFDPQVSFGAYSVKGTGNKIGPGQMQPGGAATGWTVDAHYKVDAATGNVYYQNVADSASDSAVIAKMKAEAAGKTLSASAFKPDKQQKNEEKKEERKKAAALGGPGSSVLGTYK
eukprot:g9808.t1